MARNLNAAIIRYRQPPMRAIAGHGNVYGCSEWKRRREDLVAMANTRRDCRLNACVQARTRGKYEMAE